jgi:hypothetical protein
VWWRTSTAAPILDDHFHAILVLLDEFENREGASETTQDAVDQFQQRTKRTADKSSWNNHLGCGNASGGPFPYYDLEPQRSSNQARIVEPSPDLAVRIFDIPESGNRCADATADEWQDFPERPLHVAWHEGRVLDEPSKKRVDRAKKALQRLYVTTIGL